MKKNIVLIPLLLSMLHASAQIEGNVVDTAGNAIQDAVIIAVDSVSNKADTTKSGKTGFFEFKKLTRGKYKVTVTATAFQNFVSEKILINNETPEDNPGGNDISNAIWLEIVMRRAKPTK